MRSFPAAFEACLLTIRMTLFTDLRGSLLLQYVVKLYKNTSCVQLCFGIGVIDVRVIYYLILDLSREIVVVWMWWHRILQEAFSCGRPSTSGCLRLHEA